MSYIRTLNNHIFDYIDINNNNADIEEIAGVLSKIPRWLGHTKKFYSVAQHCCWCYDNTNGDKLEALMHDASEAYMGDCPTPLKALLQDFRKIEDDISVFLAEKFKYQYPYSRETHDVDKRALHLERTFLKNLDANYFPLKAPITDQGIDYWSSDRAKEEFLSRFYNEINMKKG